MNKEDIVKIVAEEFNISEIEVLNYFDDIFETLIECFRKNKNVNISEFGKFFVKVKLSTEGVKEKVVSFSPVKKLADEVNYNFNNLTKIRLRTLEERALDDIAELHEADINLPEDLEIPDTVKEPEEKMIEKEIPTKEKVEPAISEDKEIQIEEVVTDAGDIKKSTEDIHLEKKPEEEKEDKDFDVDTEMRSFLLEHIGTTVQKEQKLKGDEQVTEVTEKKETEEKDETISKEEFQDELEKITAERDKLISEIDELHLEKKEIDKEKEHIIPAELDKVSEKEEILPKEEPLPEKEEEKFIPQELDETANVEEFLHSDVMKDSEEIIIEETEIDKEEEQPIIKRLDETYAKDFSQRTEDVKKEIEEIFAERNRILSEIVELDLDKPGLEEEPVSKQQEEIKPEETVLKEKEEETGKIEITKDEVKEEGVTEKDEVDKQDETQESISDKDELSKMVEERKKIIAKIENYEMEGFKKSSKDIGGEEIQDKEEKEVEDIVQEDGIESISKEVDTKSEEPVIKQEEVTVEGTEELRTEFEDELETIRSGILYSKNVEEDVNKILDERKKIIKDIANVELDVFDKLMEESDEKDDDTDINKDIESLRKIRVDLGKTDFRPVIEDTLTSQAPAVDVVETDVEFKISGDVKKLHQDIVEEDSNLKEEKKHVEEPKSFDDIFMKEEQKFNEKKSVDKKSEGKNTQDNFDDVFK